MQHLVYSEAGHDHLNEDCARAEFHPYNAELFIGVLADGQGGQFGGGVAARLAVQFCFERALTCSPAELLDRQSWREILQSADAAVEAHSEAGFTTLIGLCATPTQICGASCGDSAAMMVDADYLELTAMQRKNPPVGSGGATPVTFAVQRPVDTPLLLMSDGVWKFVGLDRIAATARECAGADLILQLRALQLAGNGGQLADDFSLIAVW